ncbi:twin-arginine translocase TatA/TatE family subunit, partial [Streptomyces sp. KAI-27]|nr:twin-arginine translocase TatA/TatE family subunit [Streptomyces sp. KAI-27]
RSLRILKSEARALKEEEGVAVTPAEGAKAERPGPPAA